MKKLIVLAIGLVLPMAIFAQQSTSSEKKKKDDGATTDSRTAQSPASAPIKRSSPPKQSIEKPKNAQVQNSVSASSPAAAAHKKESRTADANPSTASTIENLQKKPVKKASEKTDGTPPSQSEAKPN